MIPSSITFFQQLDGSSPLGVTSAKQYERTNAATTKKATTTATTGRRCKPSPARILHFTHLPSFPIPLIHPLPPSPLDKSGPIWPPKQKDLPLRVFLRNSLIVLYFFFCSREMRRLRGNKNNKKKVDVSPTRPPPTPLLTDLIFDRLLLTLWGGGGKQRKTPQHQQQNVWGRERKKTRG